MATTKHAITVPEPYELIISEADSTVDPFDQFDLWCQELGLDPNLPTQSWSSTAPRAMSNEANPSFFSSLGTGYPNGETAMITAGLGFYLNANVSYVAQGEVTQFWTYDSFVDRPDFQLNFAPVGAYPQALDFGKGHSANGVALYQWRTKYALKYSYVECALRVSDGVVELVVKNLPFDAGDVNSCAVGFIVHNDADAISEEVVVYTMPSPITDPTPKRFTFSFAQYYISGSVNEDLDLNKFEITVQQQDSGYMSSKVIVDTIVSGDYEVLAPNQLPLRVTIQPKCSIWKPGTDYEAGDVIYATNPLDYPYYYRTNADGVTGSTEPTWPTAVLSTVVDNTITWNRLDHLVQPQTHAPLIPVEVV